MRQTTFCIDAGSRDTKSGSEPPEFLKPIAVRSWSGPNGSSFRHTIYSLLGCPPFATGGYVLVEHMPNGSRRVLGLGRGKSAVGTVNLAHVRESGAKLGANEVHLYDCIAD